MTDMAADRRSEGLTQRVSAWIARRQEQVSDYLHADGDALARKHGWTIAKTTGRFGFGARVYRDPRFDKLAGARRREPSESEMCGYCRNATGRGAHHGGFGHRA
jgi:hypothetical protein